MKKVLAVAAVFFGVILSASPTVVFAYDFGDYRSVTLTTRAWEALEKGDIEAVLAYTNKCIELYGEQAKKMQASLTGYVVGANQDIFNNWALNDVATGLFIQGEAYRKAKMMDEAKEVYQKLIDEYTYGQCWDPKGWFWKPAEAAKEKLNMIASGSTLDFGDYTSETLTVKAWDALNKDSLEDVLAYTNKCIDLYAGKAKEMQASLMEFPWGKTLDEEKEKTFALWALNDVGTCYFIQGEAYKKAGKNKEAKDAYGKVTSDYSYAKCWDPQGWFWKVADGAQMKLGELKELE